MLYQKMNMDEGNYSDDWRFEPAAVAAIGEVEVGQSIGGHRQDDAQRLSADDTRRLVDSLATQLEPNPLRSSKTSGGSADVYVDIDTSSFACGTSGIIAATTAYDDRNRSTGGADASTGFGTSSEAYNLPVNNAALGNAGIHTNTAQSMQYQQQQQQQQQQQASSSYPYNPASKSAVDNSNNDVGPDQNVAAFTEQDEKDELATLTIQEILDAEQDVRGQLAAAMGGLSVNGGTTGTTTGTTTSNNTIASGPATSLMAMASSSSAQAQAQAQPQAAVQPTSYCGGDPFHQSSATASSSDPASSSSGTAGVTFSAPPQLSIEETSALLLLRAELLRIPSHQKRSYTNAVHRSPDQVDQQVQLAYLRRDGYDAHAAAGRIVQYWENRLAVFGEGRCYLPMTLDGAAGEEVGDMRSEALPYSTTVLPVRDTNGRAVVYVKANRLGRTDSIGMEKMMRAFWYVLDTAASSSDGLQNGFVVVVNGTDTQRRHFSVKVFRLIRQLLWDILPTKAKCTHLCHPSKVNYYIVQPLVRAVFGKELRIRQRVHYGTTEKVLSELRQYALPPEVIPQDMGGHLQLNFEERMLELALTERRRFLQTSGALEDVFSIPMSLASTSSSPMDTSSFAADASTFNKKRDDIHPDAFKGPSTARSSKSSTGGRKRRSGNAKSISSQKSNNRKGRSGRKSDPRMQRAVQIKLDNPDTALKDALQMGGFEFHLKNPAKGRTDKNLVDENGVSLSQHKNNLCRRLRQGKATASAKSNNSESSAGVAEVVSCSARMSSTAEDAATSAAAAAFSTGLGAGHASSENFERPTRRDSFDDAIAEIPQIEVDEVFSAS